MQSDTIPYNIDTEKIILGYILIHPNAIDEIRDSIKSEFFFDNRNKQIYLHMLLLSNQSITITNISLNQELLSNNLNYEKYIKEIISMAFNILNISNHIKLLINLALKRGLLSIANNIINTIKQNIISSDINKCLIELDNDVYKLMESNHMTANNFIKLNHAISDLIADINNTTNSHDIISGYKHIDKKINFKKGDLVILAARPGMGKTAFALNFIYNNAINLINDNQIHIGLFSLEMSTIQISNRLLALEAQVDSNKILNNQLSEEEYNKIRLATQRLQELQIFIDDSAALTIDKIRTKAKKLKKTKKINLLVIDYLQLIQVENKYNNRVLEISQITQSLKALAKELEIPILTLSQLSRSVESRTDRIPLLSDLRDSGSIEQDADVVLFIYRDDYYNQNDEKQENSNNANTQIIIAKNRNGPTGVAHIQFIPEYSQFISIQ
ncbi:MAG: replicative DNA helicase [Pseudomonadota bacterium]